MSKKENIVEEKVNATLEALDKFCAEGEHERPTLKAIAAALEVPQQRIYSVAKQPKAGEVYDANVYNWDAIDRFITRRLDADKGLATHEDVILKAIEMDIEFKKNDGRKGVRATTKADIVLSDGSSMPARKAALEVGQVVMLRQDKEAFKYTIVYLTDTHVVLQKENMPTLSCYSNWTVNQKFITDASRFDDICAEREARIQEAMAAAANSDTSDGTVIG